MGINSTLKSKPVITEIQANGTQISLDSVLGIKESIVTMISPEISKSVIDDDTLTTPITVDLSEHPNINHFLIFGVYLEDDTPNGIAAGDYAPIQVQLNNSGVYVDVNTRLELGGSITNLIYRKKNSDTRKVKVIRLISSSGS